MINSIEKIGALKRNFLILKRDVEEKMCDAIVKDQSHLQNYLYFMHYPVFSFTESVLILCENNKSHVAKVLLRSLIEAHINVIYHQVHDTERALALSAKAGLDKKISGTKELRDLVNKYPNLKSDNPKNLFNVDWLKNANEWAVEQREAIMLGNELKSSDKDPDLKSKAIKCDQNSDKVSSLTGVEKGHFERIYQVIFRQLSPTSHLNIDGIQTFVGQDETGMYFFDDGDDGCFISEQAVEISVVFTKDLYDNKVIVGEVPEIIKTIEKQIH